MCNMRNESQQKSIYSSQINVERAEGGRQYLPCCSFVQLVSISSLLDQFIDPLHENKQHKVISDLISILWMTSAHVI